MFNRRTHLEGVWAAFAGDPGLRPASKERPHGTPSELRPVGWTN